MQGKIVKGIAGFYYVHVVGSGIYECKAKGIFRKDKQKPLVGDNVELDIISKEEMVGNITRILPRKNALIRPAVANVDQAVVIFAATKPAPNFNLLDRFLILMESQHVPAVICFNKTDLTTEEEWKFLADVYKNTGYQVIFTSAEEESGLDPLKKALAGKTSTVAGPSGVGKSSLINRIAPHAKMETGEISAKIDRGKHTTRHSELFPVGDDSYIMDTPGFSSLSVEFYEKEELWELFPEFLPHEPYCKFTGCAHVSEPNCGIKDALSRGEISQERYHNYVSFYKELKDKKKY